jgi:hypothetical protein
VSAQRSTCGVAGVCARPKHRVVNRTGSLIPWVYLCDGRHLSAPLSAQPVAFNWVELSVDVVAREQRILRSDLLQGCNHVADQLVHLSGRNRVAAIVLHGSRKQTDLSRPLLRLRDTNVFRPSQPQHAVHYRNSDGHLGHSTIVSAEPQSIANDLFVATNRRLDFGTGVVAAGLLP